MADQEEEDLRMALRMSMQQWPPEPKRSKPRESGGAPTGSPDDSPEAKSRRLQRELMAAAAEKRLMMSGKPASPARRNVAFPKEEKDGVAGGAGGDGRKEVSCGMELSDADVNQLFSMVFGNDVSKGILAQWCNQGISIVMISLGFVTSYHILITPFMLYHSVVQVAGTVKC
uniref:Uncharacterized protein n=1 Tax=Vitis vinifera TaxID=29760 RepID=A5BRA0_VITVI|nr:hypothetical protein VITISV_014959 [Vitis vinifera]